MRRRDREITHTKKIQEIIEKCHCCRLGFSDNGRVYIVPLNFGWEIIDGSYVFYFHGAKEGRKIDLINETHYAGFEMDTGYQLHEGLTACSYSAGFQSVIGSGRVDIIENAREKKTALNQIMKHNTEKSDWKFSDDRVASVCVFRLTAAELSCKEHF